MFAPVLLSLFHFVFPSSSSSRLPLHPPKLLLPSSLPHPYRLVAYEYLTREGPRVLISTNFVYLIKQTPPTASDVEAKIPLEILQHCRDTTSRGGGGENGKDLFVSPQVSSITSLPLLYKHSSSGGAVGGGSC